MKYSEKEYIEFFEHSKKNTMTEILGIELIKISEKELIGTMPINNNTKQPYGILHGGASASFIETIGSYGSNFIIDNTKQIASGLEISTHHIKSVSEGKVICICNLKHKGRTTHIWTADIFDEKNNLIATGKLTVFIKDIDFKK